MGKNMKTQFIEENKQTTLKYMKRYSTSYKVKVKVTQSGIFVTPWPIQSMEFSRPGYWSG